MKSTFLCIVILITYSGCIIGDLEFYPDYQRSEDVEEEWPKEESLIPYFRKYIEEHKPYLYKPHTGFPYRNAHREQPVNIPWPSIITQNALSKENLARKLAELTYNIHEPNRRPQYFFKTHSLSKEEENRLNLFNRFNEDNDEDTINRIKPNYGILDDVRLNPNIDNTDYNLPIDYPEQVEEQRGIVFEPEGSENDEKIVFPDESPEFAYVPSDPRFLHEYPAATPTLKYNKNQDIGSVEDSISFHNRKGESQSRTTPLVDLKSSGYRSDNGLDVVAIKPSQDTPGVYIIAIVAGIGAAATVTVFAFAIGWHSLQKHVKNAADVEYPAYGVTGPNKDISPSGDRRLAQSAQMYHYQHQKQQIIAMERAAASERHGSVSEADSEEENEEGDYTVYECPGLAPTGEMEVKNPLFQDDPTPAQTPNLKLTENGVDKK